MIRTIGSVLGRQRRAAVMLNASRDILYANRFAWQIENLSEIVNFNNNKFRHYSRDEDIKFEAALNISTEQSIPSTLYFEDEKLEYPIRVDIIPVLDGVDINDHERPLTIILMDTFIVEPIDLNAQFRSVYKLTPTELELVRSLLQGSTLKDCARIQNRAISTIRWTVGNVYTKTATSSQRELIALASLFVD